MLHIPILCCTAATRTAKYYAGQIICAALPRRYMHLESIRRELFIRGKQHLRHRKKTDSLKKHPIMHQKPPPILYCQNKLGTGHALPALYSDIWSSFTKNLRDLH